jgi:AbrB family looped-hinge helix DNA binding protein
MSRTVKNRARIPGGSRVSSKHQVTIPAAAFAAAGLQEGDAVVFEVDGPGRLTMRREADPLEALAGSLVGASDARRDLERQRDEWQ